MTFAHTISAISRTVPKRSILSFICLTILMGLTESLAVVAIVPFVSVVSGNAIDSGPFMSVFTGLANRSNGDLLLMTGLLAIGALAFRNVLAASGMRYQLRLVTSIGDRLSKALLVSYLNRPYTFFLQRDSTELTKNILSEATLVANGVASPAMQLVAYSVMASMVFGVVLIASPIIGSALTGIIALGYGVVHLLARGRMDRLGVERLLANSQRFAAAGEAVRGYKELRLLGRERMFIEDFAKPSRIFAERTASIQTAANLPRFFLEVLVLASVVVLVISTGQGQGTDALPILALYTLAAYRLLPALQQIYASYSSLRAHRPNAELILNDLKSTDTMDQMDQGLPIVTFPTSIRLDNVSFSFNEGEPTFTNLSLVLPVGEIVGLTGPSGSGKSTLVHLLTGLLTPSQGSVLLDNQPLSKLRLRDWYGFVGYVPQETYIASTTVRSNIALGESPNEIDETRLQLAVKHAALDELLESAEGPSLETQVGEQGSRLSGGQRQRIGIARALYRNPSLLILDEATSGIDQATESRILESLRTGRPGITVLLVTHRIAAIRQCRAAFHLVNGHLRQDGQSDPTNTM